MDFAPEHVTSLDQLHAIELEALVAIDRVCHAHGIRWFLHGGTLLGGIREGGPLAWDDDVDICMLGDDFRRFKDVAHELGPRFVLVDPAEQDVFFDFLPRVRDLAYTYPNARADAAAFGGMLDHPDIDIFVPERACIDPRRDARQALRLKLNYALALGHRPSMDHGQFSGAAKLASYILPLLGRRKSIARLAAQRDALAAWGDSPDKMIIINEQPAYWHLRWERSWYEGERSCSFAGETLPVPVGAEDVLVNVYGEGWKTPPPASERRPQHAELA